MLLDRLEEWHLAGGIDRRRYDMWRHDRSNEGGGGLVGLAEVAARMGVAAPDGGFRSARYFPLYSQRYRDLPELLAAYIETFADMRPDVSP